MALPNPDHVKQAFWKIYFAEHQTWTGVEDAFLWWQNPTLKCAILVAERGGKKCKAPCESCLNRAVRKVA